MTRDEYNKTPNTCLNCGKEIIAQKGVRLRDVKRKKFCNLSCSAIHNNTGRVRSQKPDQFCSCGKQISKRSSTGLCRSCALNLLERSIENQTKTSLADRRNYYNSWRSSISRHAVRVFDASGLDKKCAICGYETRVDICHVKPVAMFCENALITEINDLSNLVPLCPNHHWEFDHGILNLAGHLW